MEKKNLQSFEHSTQVTRWPHSKKQQFAWFSKQILQKSSFIFISSISAAKRNSIFRFKNNPKKNATFQKNEKLAIVFSPKSQNFFK